MIPVLQASLGRDREGQVIRVFLRKRRDAEYAGAYGRAALD
jgi:hypothetical protein